MAWGIWLGAAIIIGIGVFCFLRGRKSDRRRQLGRLARQLGFKFVESKKSGDPPTTSISLSRHREYCLQNVYAGAVSGVGVSFFDIICYEFAAQPGGGSGSKTWERQTATTRVKVHLKGHTVPTFLLIPKSVSASMGKRLPASRQIVFQDDVPFSERNLLMGEEEQSIHALFDSPSLRKMFHLNKKICVEGKRDRLSVYWHDSLLSPAHLREVIQFTLKVAVSLNFSLKETAATGSAGPHTANPSPAISHSTGRALSHAH